MDELFKMAVMHVGMFLQPDVAGPDAHGTNAEWYNTVCSNVLAAVATSCDPPVELSWLEGVNSNAYYFVDVVAERGPAPIWFTGDRESRLGDPVVVARAGETNRVPLLIGVDYAVTSDTPFSVSFPADYMYVEVETNAPPAGAIAGYFSSVQTPLHATHDAAMGAGAWWPVTTNAYWRMDTAKAPLFPHPWSPGTLRWDVPMAWGYPYAGDTPRYRREVLPNPAAMQIYSIGEWGTTTIQKSGHVIERNIFNDIWLDGVKVN